MYDLGNESINQWKMDMRYVKCEGAVIKIIMVLKCLYVSL